MADFAGYFWRMWDDVMDVVEADVLAEELFDVRNEVVFNDFPEYTITGRMDPAHRAVYTALAKYVLENYERKTSARTV